jgi:MFS family permease
MWASFGDIYGKWKRICRSESCFPNLLLNNGLPVFGISLGRRNIYLISFSIYVVGSIGCALSVNIGMLICFRAFSAIGSSSVRYYPFYILILSFFLAGSLIGYRSCHWELVQSVIFITLMNVGAHFHGTLLDLFLDLP